MNKILVLSLVLSLAFASEVEVASDTNQIVTWAYKGHSNVFWWHYETFDPDGRGLWYGYWDGVCYHGDFLIPRSSIYTDSDGWFRMDDIIE
jgi:hypothetical protein